VRPRAVRFLLVATAVALGCRDHPSIPSSHQPAARPVSPATSQGPVEVSQHHVGPIPLDSSLGYIAAHFPGYTAGTTYLEATPIPAWTFALGGVTATATQVEDSMDLTAPAETWLIAGTGILLPGRVPLPDTWGDFREHYRGDVELSIDELGVHFEACELPGLVFFVTVDYGGEDTDKWTADSLPGGAPVGQIGVYPRQKSTSCPSPAGLPN